MEMENSEEISNSEMKNNDDILVTTDSNNHIKEVNNVQVPKEKHPKAGALSFIAMEYNSSDSESEEEKEIIDLENLEVEIISETEAAGVEAKITKIAEEKDKITEEVQVAEVEAEISKVPEIEAEITELVEVPEVEAEVIKVAEVGAKVTEVEILKEYRSHVEIVFSSDEFDSESDSSSSDDSKDSSESDSSSESSDEEERNKINETENNNKNRQRCRKVSKGEFDDLPPIEELKINVPEVLCDPLGEVAWIVDQMVVVRPKPGKPTLNLDTVLFVERGRRVLGRIFDVFGQVSDPHYCVRFNNSQHIEESNIKVGMNVYFCPNTEYTTVVFLHELSKMKACDPTDADEPPQFSDDEEEQAYYQNLRKQQKNDKAESESGIPSKKKRNAGPKSANGKQRSKTDWKSHHPWNTRKHVQSHNETGESSQQAENPSASNQSQNWYGPSLYQQNFWTPFQAPPNPVWPMYYPPRNYSGNNNFRPQMGFPPPFQPPRFSNTMSWNVRNHAQFSQNVTTENSSAGSVISLRPPPPPPPLMSLPSSTQNLSPPGL